MSNSVHNEHTGLRVQIDQSRVRQTPKTDFGTVMAKGMGKTADTLASAGALAAPFVPGGAVLSAAITGVGSLRSAAAGQSAAPMGGNATPLVPGSGTPVGGSTGMGGAMAGGSSGAVDALAASGDPNAAMMAETRRMQELNMSFNMQYLMLQQKLQSDNRQFTTLSNVMKTKHDTAKNAINNLR